MPGVNHQVNLNAGLALHDMRTYFIDVMLRGHPGNCPVGAEPIIAALRMALEVPETMTSSQMARAVAEQVRKISVRFADDNEQLGLSIEQYEEASADLHDDSVPPALLPN